MEKNEALQIIKTIFEREPVDFKEITQALLIVMITDEDKENILKAGMKKIKETIRKGAFDRLFGVNEFVEVLQTKEAGKEIAETVSVLLTTVLPKVRLGVLENIAGIEITSDDMHRTVKDYLISSGMSLDMLSEKLINQMIEYRFVHVVLKDKEIENIDSFADLVDALTLEKRIYRLKKVGIVDLLPGTILDPEIRKNIESVLDQTITMHPKKLTDLQKEDLVILINQIQKKYITYSTYPGETIVSIVLAGRDDRTDEEIQWSSTELQRIKHMASLLGTKAVKFFKERSQYEEITHE
jgi:hypothetical protein